MLAQFTKYYDEVAGQLKACADAGFIIPERVGISILRNGLPQRLQHHVLDVLQDVRTTPEEAQLSMDNVAELLMVIFDGLDTPRQSKKSAKPKTTEATPKSCKVSSRSGGGKKAPRTTSSPLSGLLGTNREAAAPPVSAQSMSLQKT